MKIQLHEYANNTAVLGPGRRFAIWVQGCCFSCEGCLITNEGGFTADTSEVAALVRESCCEGITISGGEPFIQAKALCSMIDDIKRNRDIGVIVYTGFTIEELTGAEAPEYSAELLERSDLLIDGRYVRKLDDSKALRGSSNQRVIPLSNRYKGDLHIYGVEGRQVEWKVLHGRRFMIGVPNKFQLEQFQKMNGVK